MVKIKKIYFIVTAIIFFMSLFYFYQPMKQNYQSHRIAKTNPYLSFDEAVNCKCSQNAVVTPFLKVIGLIKNEKPDDTRQKWLIQSDNDVSILFEIDTQNCAPFNFNKYDLVRIKGDLVYLDNGPTISKVEYVDYQGKKYCETH